MKNDKHLLLRVRQDNKSRVKNDVDLLSRVREDKMSRVKKLRRHVAKC